MNLIPPLTTKAVLTKLKTNLTIIVNRLKLLERKKTEIGLKSRKEIAEYIKVKKFDKARIKVEHIIRDDYLVESYEILEMFCDLLLSRFGLIEFQKEIDPGLEEAISSIIWSVPRLKGDIMELQTVEDMLSRRYNGQYVKQCHENLNNKVNSKFMHRITAYVPSKKLVEMYLVEISKNFNVEYIPDLPPEDLDSISSQHSPKHPKSDSIYDENLKQTNKSQPSTQINNPNVTLSFDVERKPTTNTEVIISTNEENHKENDIDDLMSRFNKLKNR